MLPPEQQPLELLPPVVRTDGMRPLDGGTHPKPINQVSPANCVKLTDDTDDDIDSFIVVIFTHSIFYLSTQGKPPVVLGGRRHLALIVEGVETMYQTRPLHSANVALVGTRLLPLREWVGAHRVWGTPPPLVPLPSEQPHPTLEHLHQQVGSDTMCTRVGLQLEMFQGHNGNVCECRSSFTLLLEMSSQVYDFRKTEERGGWVCVCDIT